MEKSRPEQITKLLMLEDSTDDASLVQKTLKKADFKLETKVVSSRQEFIEALDSFSPGIVLSDHTLPQFSSPEALQICREKFPFIPFIVVTGNVSEEFAAAIIKAGADDYVLKNNLKPLAAAITRAIEKKLTEETLAKAQQELINNEKRFRLLIENSYDMLALLDAEGRIEYISPAMEKTFGVTNEENRTRPGMEFVHPDDVALILAQFGQVLENPGTPVHSTLRGRKKDGTHLWLEGTITNMLTVPGIKSVVINFRDITERKQAEEKISHVNRLYAFLSKISQVIVHSSDEQALFKEVCHIAIESGKFKMASIGLFDSSQTKINLIVECGAMPDYKALFLDTTFEKNSPQDYVLRTSHPFICNDVGNDPEIKWKVFASTHNIGSYMVLPINKLGNTIGTINLYAQEKNFFDKTEVDLLEKAEADISFALDGFEKEKMRRLAEDHLAYSELKMKEAQQIAHLGNWEINFATGIPIMSDEACRIYGLSPGESIPSYESWLSFVHPDDLDGVRQLIKGAHQTLATAKLSYRIILRDGTVKYLYSEAKFEFDEHAKPTGLAGITLDVTQLKMAELNIEFDRNNLKSLINNTNDLIWSVDRNFKLITFNHAFYEMVKYMTGESITKGCDILTSVRREDERQRFMTFYKRALSGETFTEIEYTDTPVVYWSEISYYPIRKGDEVIGTACYSRDVTSRKEIEEQIKNSEEKRRLIMNAAIDAIVCIDLKGIVTFWNPQAEKVFGWKAAEAIGRMLADLIIPEAYRERHINGLENYLKTGSGPVLNLLLELSAINRENKQFPIELTILPIKQGQDEFFCAFIRDITERTNALQAIKTQNAKLREIAWTQSHSVRAPLARIMGLTNLLTDHSLRKADSSEIVNHLVNSSHELDEVIRAIVRRTEQVEIEEANLKISPATPP